MPNSRCFLIGHRDTSTDILPSLTAEIERHIREQSITEFVVGFSPKVREPFAYNPGNT